MLSIIDNESKEPLLPQSSRRSLKALGALVCLVLVSGWLLFLAQNNSTYAIPSDLGSLSACAVANATTVTVTTTATATVTATPSPTAAVSAVSKDPREPRFIFVDLGANTGDTCWSFLQDPRANDKVSYPKPPGKNYSDAEIYLFEANPSFSAELVAVKQELTNKGMKVEIFPGTPVWTEQKTMPFHVQTDGGHHAAGSSLDPAHPDISASRGGVSVNLTTISIAHWLLENTLPQDFVVVKMDIELAEYAIVPHLAQMQAYTVIDYLLVEWHWWLIDQKDHRIPKVNEAAEVLKKNGVKMPSYSTAAKRK